MACRASLPERGPAEGGALKHERARPLVGKIRGRERTCPCGYTVLQQVGDDDWRSTGEVDRRPGLPARRSRGQAIRDVIGRDPEDGEVWRCCRAPSGVSSACLQHGIFIGQRRILRLSLPTTQPSAPRPETPLALAESSRELLRENQDPEAEECDRCELLSPLTGWLAET